MGSGHAMKLDVYLNYGGNCEQAFRFYEQQLGGKITMMMMHGQQPNPANAPANRNDGILHSRIEIGKRNASMRSFPTAVRSS